MSLFGAYKNTSLSQPCSMSTDVENQISFDDINVYPNFASDIVNISTTKFRMIKDIKIFNSAGLLVDTIVMTSDKIEIDLSDYSSGLYYLTFTQNDGVHVTKKLTVIR